jgi:hypothetical protein
MEHQPTPLAALVNLADVLIHAAERGAFLSRVITTRDGKEPYLTRYLLSAGPDDFPGLLKLFGVTEADERAKAVHRGREGLIYLHHIHRADDDPNPHTHPWEGFSLILRGGYKEELYMPSGEIERFRDGQRYMLMPTSCTFRTMTPGGPFAWNSIQSTKPHRISTLLGDTWSLVQTTNRVSSWGFLRLKPKSYRHGPGWREAEYVDFKRYFRELEETPA